MTHRRDAGSEDEILVRNIRDLSPADIQQATGKSPDHFYKISNPTNDLRLHLTDAIALDILTMKLHGQARFLALFQSSLAELASPHPILSRRQSCLIFGEVLGALCAAQREHDKDGKLTPDELEREIRIVDEIVARATTFSQELKNRRTP